eukprot:GFUD01034530.1.p1 GENE.GFUD01034530.1~~GFUD01034530.1.p1  ORF type:complete len:274 (-),score=73.55 GFUD01034530.1:97-918(-)
MKIKLHLKSSSSRRAAAVSESSSPGTQVCSHQLDKTGSILHKTCQACQGSIWPGQLHVKCSHCMLVLHAACKESVAKVLPRSLTDFISTEGVAVPSILVNCLAQIESRGLDTEGLYRVPGDDRKIKALSAKLAVGENLGHRLADVDVHVLCGVVKEFLRSLKHSLIPAGMQSLFLTMDSEQEVQQGVCMLAPPYRDTLAFLMLHLQKVVKSGATKMSAESLSTVLAMSVIGNIEGKEMQLEDMLLDNRDKRIVMEEMIKMDPTAWKMILAGKC